MDFLINLPSLALNDLKFNALMVVEDMLLKMIYLILTTTIVKSKGVSRLYFDKIYKLHGLLKAIVSGFEVYWHILMSASDNSQHGFVNVNYKSFSDEWSNRMG